MVRQSTSAAVPYPRSGAGRATVRSAGASARDGSGPARSRGVSNRAPGWIRSRRRQLIGPVSACWPLTFVFAPYGLWWLLGVSSFVGPLAALAMAWALVRRRSVLVPRGFGLWLLLLVWVVLGLFTLQVDAPLAVQNYSSGRYVIWAYRLGWYLTATVTLLYIGTFRRELAMARVSRALGWMFVWIVLGGLLGTFASQLSFPSVLEAVLPRGVTSNQFVQQLIHPTLVQAEMNAIGDPRPAAPFAFANVWGLNFLVFLPFFVHGWLGRGAGWRRPVGIGVAVAALVPFVSSQNRGMWLALALGVVLLAVVAAWRGRIALLVGILAAMIVGAVVLVATPFGEAILFRFNNGMSEGTRTELGTQTAVSVLQGAPFVGFGTTRDVQGTFTSIAGGDSIVCPTCSPPALGTQGHLWLLLFSQGVLGLFFYLAFFGRWFFAGLRRRAPEAQVGTVVLFAHLFTLPLYDYFGSAMFAVSAAVAFIWRVEDSERGAERHGYRIVADYTALAARSLVAILVLMPIGAVLGRVVHDRWGAGAVGSVSVVLPVEPKVMSPWVPQSTIDTEARFAIGPATLDAVSQVAGKQVTARDILLTADPNTRVLNVRISNLPNPTVAAAAAARAAQVVLAERQERLDSDRELAVTQLRERARALSANAATLSGAIDTVGAVTQADTSLALGSLRQRRSGAIAADVVALSRVSEVQAARLDAGSVVREPYGWVSVDSERVYIVTGAAFGLLAGLGLGLLRGPQLRRAGAVARRSSFVVRNVPVLATVHGPGDVRMAEARSGVRTLRAAGVVPVEGARGTARVAMALDDAVGTVPVGSARNGVVLVAHEDSRRRHIHQQVRAMARQDVATVGIVMVENREER